MCSFASTEHELLVRILALAPVRASEVSKVYPLCDAGKGFTFHFVISSLNKKKY